MTSFGSIDSCRVERPIDCPHLPHISVMARGKKTYFLAKLMPYEIFGGCLTLLHKDFGHFLSVSRMLAGLQAATCRPPRAAQETDASIVRH